MSIDDIKLPDEIFEALKEDTITFDLKECSHCESWEAVNFCSKRLQEQELQMMKILVMLKMKHEENVKLRKLYVDLLPKKD